MKLAFQKGTNDKFAVKIISKRTFSVGVRNCIFPNTPSIHKCNSNRGKGRERERERETAY